MLIVQAGLAREPASWRGTPAATSLPKTGAAPGVYRRRRPESTALYEVVRDNLETLFGAIDDGALAFRIPRHAREELLASRLWASMPRLCPTEMPWVRRNPTSSF